MKDRHSNPDLPANAALEVLLHNGWRFSGDVRLSPKTVYVHLGTTTQEIPRGSVKEIVLEPIYFDFNKFDLRQKDREILERNIQKLKENPQAKIRVEGNCDERGTVEYNLALGEKRARAAKEHMVKMGVAEDRLETISYGKEKSQHCTDDKCWSKDRRDDFVLVSQ